MSVKNSNIKVNIILSTLYQVLTLALPFFTAPYISRVLGAEGVGIYSYTTSIQMYFSMLATLGTVSYGSREIARERSNQEKVSSLFWEIELLTVLTTAITLVAWGMWIIWTDSYKIYYLILTVSLLANLFDISWLYSGLEQFKYIVSQNTIFKIIGTIALFVFVQDKNDTLIYVAILSVTTLLANLSMWVYLPKFILPTRLSTLKPLKHLKETMIYFIPTVATSVYTVLDKTMIGIFTKDINENGYYEQATKIINLLKSITFTALNTVVGSRIAFLFAEKRYEEIKGRIDQSIEYVLFIGVAICFGLLGISNNFVPIFFGDGYDRVVELLYLFSPMVIIIGISNCLGAQYYTPAGLRKQSSFYIIMGALLNFILNLFFIPLFWSHGAVLSSLLAELLIAFLYVKHSDGYMTFIMLMKKLVKKVVAGGIMLGILILLDRYFASSGYLLIIQILVGGIVYLGILLLFKDSSIKLIEQNIIKRKIG